MAAEVHLEGVDASACQTVKLFERCELTVQLSGAIDNPYDPNEVALEGRFTPQEGDSVTAHGFYYQPFEQVSEGGREAIRPAGSPVWKVRFTPRRLGRWSYAVKLITPAGSQSLPAAPFLVVNSSRQGFVRLNRTQGNFSFDTGAPFIPIGENLCWAPNGAPLAAYDRWFQELSKQRANYIRVWMAPWLLRLETKETGVGRYDQFRAWLLDALFEKSESAGLFWQLSILNHGSFSRSQDPDWQNNPYNEALGGMCRLPNDFLTDPRAKATFKRLLEYLVNRWGSNPQLVMWELFNEADFGEFKSEDLTAWLGEMSAFLQSLDPNQRPVTTSYHKKPPEEVYRSPTIDVVQLHVYDERDVPAAFARLVGEARRTFQKPVFIGEFGWIADVMRKFDDIGIHMHEGLWSSLMSGAGGGALIWYWDQYVEPNALERHFRALEAFWRGEQIGLHLQPLALSFSDGDLTGVGIGSSERGYIWVKNRSHDLNHYIAYRCELAKQRLRQARGEKSEPVTYSPKVVRGATATVDGLDQLGRYRVEWWDPYRGRIATRAMGQSRWGKLTVEVPDVGFDLAGKLIKLQWWERG